MKNKLLRNLAVLAAYFAAARLGLALSDPIDNVTLVWPATGIAVAALLRWGTGCWPGIFLAVVLVERTVNHSWSFSASIAVTSTLGPLVTAWLLKRGGFQPAFERRRDGAIFCGAAMVGMLITAAGGMMNLCWSGRIPWSAGGPAFLRWWLGDTGGVLMAASLLLCLSRTQLAHIRTKLTEFAVLTGSTLVVGWLVLMRDGPAGSGAHFMPFLTVPLVVWGASRFGFVGASFIALCISTIAAWATALGRGPFYLPDMQQGTFLLWAFIVTNAFLGLMITALQAERSRADASSREGEERLRLFIENAPVGIAIFDREMRYLALSHQWMEDHRVTGSVVGRSHYDVVPDMPEHWRAVHRRGLAGEIIKEEADRFDRPDGTTIWFRWEVHPWRAGTGEVGGIMITAEDITARKQAEAALERSASLMRATLESTADGLLIVDLTGRIADFNQRFSEMWRLPASLLATRDDEAALKFVLEQLEHPENFLTETKRLYSAPAERSFDVLTFKDGRVFERYSQPQWLDERPVGRVWSFRDVTDRRRAEEALRRTRDELEERVIKRTEELAQTNARLLIEMAARERDQAALRAGENLAATGRMAAGIAHEINNPLNGIISSFQILKGDIPPDHPDYPFVGLIEREVQRIATIVRRMFTLYKRESDPSTTFLLCQLTRDVVKLSQPVAETRGVRLVLELPEKPVPVQLPEAAMSEVLYNIIKNAVEASREADEVRVRLNVGDRVLEITVADTGTGIPPELREKIFEPFFSTKQEPGQSGMGLGLPTVRTHVVAMGGRLWFESVPGQGTTFHVELPWQPGISAGAGSSAGQHI